MVVINAVALHHALFCEVEEEEAVFHQSLALLVRQCKVGGLSVLLQNLIFLRYVQVENAVKVYLVAVVFDFGGLIVFRIVVFADGNFYVDFFRELDCVVERLR